MYHYKSMTPEEQKAYRIMTLQEYPDLKSRVGKRKYYGDIPTLHAIKKLYEKRGYLTQTEWLRLIELDKTNWRDSWLQT